MKTYRLIHTAVSCLVPFLASALALLSPASAQTAATGAIEGRALNTTSGSFLNKARVTVQGTPLETFTDENGNYRLPSVPRGVHTVTVTFTGLQPATKSVQVATGQAARLDFELSLGDSAVVRLDAFTVEEREVTAQGHALHDQRTAANIKNVVAIEEFGDLGITNPGHFLTYVPGVSNIYNTTGEVEGIGVRGMPASGTVVMFDGAQAATNDPSSRSFNFSGTSTANLDRIEVTKVPTPDLPANAVGGSINMISKSGFNRSTPQLRYNVFATMQAKHDYENINASWGKYAGPDGKTTVLPIQPGFDLNYTLPLNEAVAFTFTVGHNARLQDREYVSATKNRVGLVQTAGNLNSVLNIFTKDIPRRFPGPVRFHPAGCLHAAERHHLQLRGRRHRRPEFHPGGRHRRGQHHPKLRPERESIPPAAQRTAQPRP